MPIDEEFFKSIGLDDESVAEKIKAAWTENETGLITKRDELLNETKTYKGQLEAMEAMRADYERAKSRLTELEKNSMTEEERIAAAKDEATAQLQQERDDLAKKLADKEEKDRVKFREVEIMKAVGDKGDSELVLAAIDRLGLVQAFDKDGDTVLKIMSLDGKTELESVDKLIEQMKASEKYKRLFNSSGLSGSGARTTQATAGQDSGLFGAAKIRAARAGK